MAKRNYSYIRTIEDLRRTKRKIAKKARFREIILKRRFKRFQGTATPIYFYEQFVKSINMQNSVLDTLPFVAKILEPLKNKIFKNKNFKTVIPILGGLGAGITALFAMFKVRNNKNKPNIEEDDLFI